MRINLGDVLKENDGESIIKVIGVDDHEVFYDALWEHNETWGLNKSRSAIFYRLEKEFCSNHYSFIRNEQLDAKELNKFSPQLPHRTANLIEWSWNQTEYKTLEKFEEQIGELARKLKLQEHIKADKVMIIPLGANGGHKPKVAIAPENGESFTPIELLWKSHNIQAKYKTNIESGVGIYRLGISNKVPSYYLGGKGDSAGNFEL
jgi:hypothetical protein